LSEDEWRWFVGAEFDYERICPSLSAGYGAEEHVTDKFEPAFQFEIGKDWELPAPETTDEVWLTTGPKGGSLDFTNPLFVYDPSNLSEAKQIPAPENAGEWISWFQRHPTLKTSKPVPRSVGGASGIRIDVRASSTPQDFPREEICGPKPCVPLYPTSGGPIFAAPSD
jgi:hypothetical protein